VVDRAEGTRRVYQLNPEGFESLREYVDQFWSRALSAFKEKVEEEQEHDGTGPEEHHG
jgi:DNA-binding PadR family transcriptional regulator